MQKRISHKKSRRGCQSCKKKHVKCDEQGPPCANCVVRKIECVYAPAPEAGVKKRRAAPLARRPKRDPPQNEPAIQVQGKSRDPSPGSSGTENSTTTLAINSITSMNTPSPLAFSNFSESNRSLELELMHRWSTRSWTGLHSLPTDQEYLQMTVPREALKYEYLMNGIFAMSAADLARYSQGKDSVRYYRAALEYGSKASVAFRAELPGINPENLHLLYHFAMMAAIYNFVVPAQQTTTLNRISMVFDMILGAAHVAWTNLRWLLDSPCSFRSALKYLPEIVTSDPDPETEVAVDRLRAVSRRVLLPVPTPAYDKTGMVVTGHEPEGCFASESNLYRLCISQLRSCFSKEATMYINGYCLTFITSAGRGYSNAVKSSEPMALFILLHFGVLLDRMGNDPMQWWIATAGIELVHELSEILLDTPIAFIPEGREGIAWAREQVGLPPLPELMVAMDDYVLVSTGTFSEVQGADFDPTTHLKDLYREGLEKNKEVAESSGNSSESIQELSGIKELSPEDLVEE
ncbi:hypothetical protein FQN54_001737 [Arachnomyces sp. PD_36]|nr:hypothetical protein FQN54_001737 [Arachnomyces sp. PD_36]